MRRVTVRVPATAANLGPGFDCLGVALDIWNELTVERGAFRVEIEGEGAEQLPRDDSNFIVKSVDAAFRAAGSPLPEFAYRCRNVVPLTSGLGSSSAAIVSGVAAGILMRDEKTELDADSLNAVMGIAADMEGHPDNAAPATFGGCRVGVRDGRGWITDRIGLPQNMRAVLYMPGVEGSTATARAVLPEKVTRTDAVFNVGGAALLVNAFASGNLEVLRRATEDRLHQPVRSRMYPGMNALIQAALEAGAHGAFLSGAGPTVMALTTGDEPAVAEAMTEVARAMDLGGRVLVTDPTERGVHTVEAS